MPAACDNMATRSKGCAPDLTQLPPVTNLQHMSKREMQAFITKMLQCVTGKKNPGYGLESARPEWWPEQVPWVDINKDGKIDRLQLSLTDALRNVIVHCYLYHGRQDLLCLGPNVQVVTKPNGALSFLGGEKGHTLGDSRNTQFADPSLTSASAYIPVPGDSPARNTRSTSLSEDHRDKTFVEVFICFHCEKEYCSKTELLNHQNICEQRPSSFHQQLQTPPHKMLRNRHIPELTPLKIVQRRESGKRPPKDKFLSGLGLLPQYKAEELKKKKKDIVIDDKALEVEEPQTPRSPTTPRTPKSLLSQLTREPPDTPHTPHTPSWRRLSVCKEERPADLESVSDASSDISEADERQSGYMGRGNLLTIDVSSPLGKRVKRLVQPGSEGTGSVILDYNRFCHTPTKSAVMGKLRERNANFPITFKKTRRTNPKYYHMYTFSTRQRREQYKRLVTGLDKRGRKLARSLPKCKVVLQRLKKEDIKKWVKPVKVPVIDLKPLSTTEIALWVKTPDKDAVPKMNGTSPRDGWLAAARLPPGELDVAFREPGVHVYRSLLSELEGGSGSRGRIGNSISRGHLIVHPTSTNQEKSSGSKVGQCRSRSQSPNKSPQNKLPTLASLLDKSPAPVSSGEYFSRTCQVPNIRITSHGSPGGKFPQHVSANNNKDLVQRTSKRTCPSSLKAVAVGTQTNHSPKQISMWEEPCPRLTRRRSASSSSDSSSSSIIVLEDIPVVAAPHAGGTNTEVDQTLSESDWSLEICSVDSESSFSQEPQRRNQRSSTRGISRSEKLKQKSRDPSPCKTHRSGSAAVSSSLNKGEMYSSRVKLQAISNGDP
ncbi:uncharacterized protein LOC106175482 [Lingula anatina]|uniref:Uncharacterized protein LOC106175482 n=1 Tax=Lingula anatina TaxID=7574 RepID=A0A1S3JRK0_LINAN|nr:uncharacterized protein LOC106175482 [Lingula anatina]|eukprot:XP_013412967.1 uncharacterized protein LOC106175482 [Lingula anatina]